MAAHPLARKWLELSATGDEPHLSVYDTIRALEPWVSVDASGTPVQPWSCGRTPGQCRATRIAPSDRPQLVAGWKKRRSQFLILAKSPFRIPDQQSDHTTTCSFVSKAACHRRLWARLLGVLGSWPLILRSERVRIWVI